MAERCPEVVPRWERPIRIPERVPILHTDPEVALAGEESTWQLPFRLAEELSPDSVLKLQLFGGRNNKGVFEGAQAEHPEQDGYLTMRTADGAELPLRPDDAAGTFVVALPERGLAQGCVLTATLGAIKAPAGRMLSKFFLLYRDDAERHHRATWGEEDQHLIVGACTMHILGGEIDHLRAYAPSHTRAGEAFDILVRPEDEFSNLSHETLNTMTVCLDDEEIEAEPARVPDSTCVRMRVSLPREGVFRLRVRDCRTGQEVVTNPTVCGKSPPVQDVYWGMIHGHTEMSDGTGSLEYYFRQIRNEAGLDFAAPGDHDHLHETSEAMWQTVCATVAKWHTPGEFVTFLGYEWAKWRRNGDGDRNVYFLEDERPLYRSDEGHFPSPPDLFRAIRDEKAIVIPHHPGHSGNFCDWKDHDPVHERLVEIFQVRGSYENSAEEGNPVPECGQVPPMAEGYVSRALAMGWRVGFTAGGDDHAGHAGTDREPQPPRYNAGLMSVQASARTREAIWEALWNRRVVATTGPRVLLTYDLNGNPMGSELSVDSEPELARERRVRIAYHGTAPIARVDIIRNNQIVHSSTPGGLDCELAWDDTSPLEDASLPPAEFCSRLFCFYYVRVVQEDREVAWASPVWIDTAST